MTEIVVAALYKFARLSDPASLQASLKRVCAEAGVCGTLIVAPEGINGTMAGQRDGIALVLDYLRRVPGLAGLEHKESFAAQPPFHRMKVRLKREIVTMGVDGIDPSRLAGAYVDPLEWNALIADPDLVLIDTRNAYEVELGSFPGAIDPQTRSFRQFPAWFSQHTELHGARKFAMFCTGGIRCEKATAFLRLQGFDQVHHLKGGILEYLQTVPAEQSRWLGECFVFDQRAAVAHGTAPGSHQLCHACRHPVSPAEMASEHYVAGVSCPRCRNTRSDAQKARFAERQEQVERAARRGQRHLGPSAGEPRRTDPRRSAGSS
jgi:UPF0176 protein